MRGNGRDSSTRVKQMFVTELLDELTVSKVTGIMMKLEWKRFGGAYHARPMLT